METKKHRERVQLKPFLRTNEYLRLRRYWLGELLWIRAMRRNGTATKKDTKIAQRELVRLRNEL
jgi:hypothetical protein